LEEKRCKLPIFISFYRSIDYMVFVSFSLQPLNISASISPLTKKETIRIQSSKPMEI